MAEIGEMGAMHVGATKQGRFVEDGLLKTDRTWLPNPSLEDRPSLEVCTLEETFSGGEFPL